MEFVLSFHVNEHGETTIKIDGVELAEFNSLHLDLVAANDHRMNGRLYVEDNHTGWENSNLIKKIPGINAFLISSKT